MTGHNYCIRKLYVRLNPFLSTKAMSQRIQWIMRDAPLVQKGVPFFFEPWVNPDDFFTRAGGEYRPTRRQVVHRFLSEFWRWTKCRLTGRFDSDNGTAWRWNRGDESI
jgi:hypothetical protein